ncbi:cyanophycin synthetase [Clostridium sp. WLY-B-L2]|uniref:Cyanophycin synthetase n=1 Tax=Clostridium aromativorans TaxID=2836848 RepID=A0ABS8N1L6_9CLOT|nr:cyanophycin synthetase [Clostridium aromativorans]MCC9293693.1 cyanophycin synthetase [Clostridium aromativorans]
MRIDDFRVFEGRNIFAHRKCIKMSVDLEGYSEIPTKDINGFNEKLLTIMPDLRQHRCGINEEHGFEKRLREGTYLAHVCEHIILAMQNDLGIDVSYGKAREIKEDKYYIVYEYLYKNTALEIGKIAVNMINSLIKGINYKLEEDVTKLKDILKAEQVGPSTLSIISEAKRRGIPVTRIGNNSVFQLGYGKYSKIIEATISCNTSAAAVDIACNKMLTKEMLRNQCLPVAEGGEVKSLEELSDLTAEIGYPIVLKPCFGNQGKGVFVNIKNKTEAVKAYKILAQKFDSIILEKCITGKDFRVCVVNGKVVAAAERIPPYVVGDGIKSIIQLIEDVNRDSMRGEGHEKPLTKIKIDDELKACILKSDYKLDSILPKNKKLLIRENGNLSTGGTAVDCTDLICKENINICERAADTIGLDICGIDICCKDISESILKTGGAIIEINAAPGIRMHQYPCVGKKRNVARAIINMLFYRSRSIPIVSVTGTNGKTTTTRLIAHILGKSGYKVGMTVTGGIYIDNKCICKGDTTGYYSAKTILSNKNVDAAVLETARGGIIKKGLAYDLADVAVITNITEDHLGIDGINTMEDLAYVKALVGEAVKKNGYVVLNADDLVSSTIINRLKGSIIMFSKYKNNTILRDNIDRGGYGIYIDDQIMYFERQGVVVPIVKMQDIRISLEGKLIYNIENAMAACGAAIGLNIAYSVIKDGLKSFYGDASFNPGRFNIYNLNGINVVLDYGHNIEGYKAVIKGAKKLNYKRLVGIIGIPGDRTDTSVEKIGRIAGRNFDYIYVKEDKDRRGRKPGEIASILRRGIMKTDFDLKKIETILDEKAALERAIDAGKQGDLIIIFFEKMNPLVELISEKLKDGNKRIGNIAMV